LWSARGWYSAWGHTPCWGRGFFGQHLLAGPIWHGASLLIVFGVFGAALYETYAVLAHRAAPELPDLSRRTLLRNAVVGLVATLGAGSAYRVLNRREFRHTPRGQRLDSARGAE